MRQPIWIRWGFLLFPAVTLAQNAGKIDNDLVFNKAKYSQKNISLAPKTNLKMEFPFLESIEVVDARFDSTCVGFRNRSSEKNNQVLQFNKGLKREFENYFNRNFIFRKDDTIGYSAVLVVRNYWINEFEVDEDENDKFSESRSERYYSTKTALKATFDLYFSLNDEYFVAYRFDTLTSVFLNIKEFSSSSYMEDVLIASLKRLQSTVPESHIANKRKFSRTELENYYTERWNKPILKEKELKKGVYKIFTEFVNNQPSITQYVIKKDKLADVLSVPQKGGHMVVAREVWGYCDGKNVFIKSGENYYLLVRVQNGYYFLGSKELMKSQDEYYNYDPYTNMNFRTTSESYLRNRLFPMKVDMEKGNVY